MRGGDDNFITTDAILFMIADFDHYCGRGEAIPIHPPQRRYLCYIPALTKIDKCNVTYNLNWAFFSC